MSGFDIIYATLDESFDRANGVHSMVAWLGRPRALRLAAALHAVAFLCLAGASIPLLGATPQPAGWALPATLLALATTGVLLYLEQRWAEDVDLAFFKVNVFVGFGVLATVLAARAAGGF